MKLRIVLVAASMLCTSANAAPPAGFEQRVEKLRAEFGIPGVSVAIVENGQPTLARGWGVKTVGTKNAVDADTIFPTGSTGKAFTAAALAVLVDQGKIKWDDKVIDHVEALRHVDDASEVELVLEVEVAEGVEQIVALRVQDAVENEEAAVVGRHEHGEQLRSEFGVDGVPGLGDLHQAE